MKRHKQEPKNYSLLPIVCKSTTFYFFIQNFIFQSEIFIRGIKKQKRQRLSQAGHRSVIF